MTENRVRKPHFTFTRKKSFILKMLQKKNSDNQFEIIFRFLSRYLHVLHYNA